MVDNIPVMLLDDVPQTLAVADESLRAARAGAKAESQSHAGVPVNGVDGYSFADSIYLSARRPPRTLEPAHLERVVEADKVVGV